MKKKIIRKDRASAIGAGAANVAPQGDMSTAAPVWFGPAMKDILADYPTKSDLAKQFENYPTKSDLNIAIAPLATSAELSSSFKTIISFFEEFLTYEDRISYLEEIVF